MAELTGRKERYDSSTGKFVPRGGPDVARKNINISEMRNFQSGKKRVAVLTGAANAGISLHSSLDAPNQQQRYHITLQVGWSADRAMQMMGRTHRTNQAHPPEYVMLVSDLGGEKRFISTISRRLGSLGALTKGQKNATSGTDLMDKVNFETVEGRAASTAFYEQLMRNEVIPGTGLTGMQVLHDLRMLTGQPPTVRQNDRPNVTKLLNRLMALDPDVQNSAYNYFYDIFQATVQRAIDAGTLDTGVKTLPGDEFHIKEQRVVARDPKTGAQTMYYPVESKIRNKRVSPKDLEKRMRDHEDENPRIMVKKDGKLALVINADPIVHASGSIEEALHVSTPARGKWVKAAKNRTEYTYDEASEWAKEKLDEAERALESAKRAIASSERDVASRYGGEWARRNLESAQAKLPAAQTAFDEAKAIADDPAKWARDEWARQYEDSPSHETEEVHLIGRAVMGYWNAISDASHFANIYTVTDSKTGQRAVGVEIPADAIGNLLARITGGGSTVNAHQLITDVLRNGMTYTLEGGIQVRRANVAREPVIQMIPPNQDVARNLQAMGLVFERGVISLYYVPSGKQGTIVARVLDQYPVQSDEPIRQFKEEPGSVQTGQGAQPSKYRNGILWVGSQTMKAITDALGADPAAGMYVPPARATELRNVVTNGLGQAVADALKDRRSLVIVKRDPGDSLSQVVATARHELFHASETWAGPYRGQELLKDPTAEKAAAGLERKGYDRSNIPMVWSEIGAHLASGPAGWDVMGLSRDEAKGLFAKYLSLLDQQDINKLQRISPQLNEELYAARSIGSEASDVRRNGSEAPGGLEGGAGEGRVQPGVRQDVPIRQSREDREPRLLGERGGEVNPQVIRPAAQIADEIKNIKPLEGETPAQMLDRGKRLLQEYSDSLTADRRLNTIEVKRRLRDSEMRLDKAKRDYEEGVFNAVKKFGDTADAIQASNEAKIAEARKYFTDRGTTLEAEQERQRKAVEEFLSRAKSGERGAAPMLSDLIQGTKEAIQGGNYSVAGAAESAVVRGLGQTKRASPPVHEAMLRAASPEARSAAIIRASMPLIRKTLEGSDVSAEQLLQYYVDSRLQALRGFWSDLSRQAGELADEQMEEDFHGGGEDGSMSQDFVDMLDNLEGKKGIPENPGQIAAALVEQKNWDELRNYLSQVFELASAGVPYMMDPAEFDYVHDLVQNDPRVNEADRLYGLHIEKPIAENHALNEGIFTERLGPANRYFPLIPAGEGKPGFFERLAFKKPKNSRNVMATGMSRTGYTVAIDKFRKAIEKDLAQGGRAAVIEASYAAGLMRKVPRKGSIDTDVFKWRGEEYPAKVVIVQPPKMVIQGGKTFHTKAVQAYMPKWFYNEIKGVLEKEGYQDVGVIRKALSAINTLALQGPADLTFHSANLVGALIGNTPFLSPSLGGMAASSNILTKKIQALALLATTDQTEEEAVHAFHELAEAGALPTRYASETYSKALAAMTGAKVVGIHAKTMNPFVKFTLSPILYGPKGIDARARYIMWKVAKSINPNVKGAELNEFVNQLGNYTPALWSDLEKAVKSFPFSPFYTAGSTMIRNGINAVFSSGPMITPGSGGAANKPWLPRTKTQWRMWHALTVGVLGTLALWFKLSHDLTGKYPWQDKRSKLLAFPVGGGTGVIDKYRHSKLGNALWGTGPEVGYINLYSFTPLMRRGMAAMGLPSAYETLVLGGSGGQASESAQKDAFNTLSHPIMGPEPRALFTAAFGKEMYLTNLRDRRGALAPSFMPAIPSNTKPGWPTIGRRALAAGMELNAFAQTLGEVAGVHGEERKNETEAQRDAKHREAFYRNVLGMSVVFTGLVGAPSNPYSRSEALRTQRSGTR